MGFRKENYYPLGRRLSTFIFLFISLTAYGQNHCLIEVATDVPSAVAVAGSSEQDQSGSTFFVDWTELEGIENIDGQPAVLNLEGYKRSKSIIGNNLNLNIPAGAEILGIELRVNGRIWGEGNVRDVAVHLMDADGNVYGESRHMPDGFRRWYKSEEYHNWSYGNDTDLWGAAWTAEMLNDDDFGFQLQICNTTSRDIEANLEKIEVIVHYQPLYTICENTCVSYRLDIDDYTKMYRWRWPEGFKMISYNEHEKIVNIGVDYADYGTYEVCIDEIVDGERIEQCCRKFNYIDCNPGSIGDQAWIDLNGNSWFDPNDEPLVGATVRLFDASGTERETTITDINGNYLFPEVTAGDYYVGIDIPEGYFPVEPNQGGEHRDSDITSDSGTTDLFSVAADENITDIDFGVLRVASLGDFVWEDLNKNGLQDEGEPGVAGVSIRLFNEDFDRTITTDEDGRYSFDNVPAAVYTLTLTLPEGYFTTDFQAGSGELDNDLDETGSIEVDLTEGGTDFTIDVGIYQEAVIGDFIWLDENENGLQDEGELGAAGVKLYLLDEANEVLDSTVTDENGAYVFSVEPGSYRLQLGDISGYNLTISSGEETIDSDFNELPDGAFKTTLITVVSGEEQLDIDGGLILNPAFISGLTWIDANNDGQRQPTETAITDISVELFDGNDQLLRTILVDENGFYQFENLTEGTYYLRFSGSESYIFSSDTDGPSDTNSDVDESGTTGSISVTAGEVIENIDAGYVGIGGVSGRVWIDNNKNNIFDEGDTAEADVNVGLYNKESREFVSSTLTTSESEDAGSYSFEDVPVGQYWIVFGVEEKYIYVEPNVGEDDSVDSDVVVLDSIFTGLRIGITDPISVSFASVSASIDAGIVELRGNISGSTWKDGNNDGQRQESESFLTEVTVELYDESDQSIGSAVVDENGNYEFSDLADGNYYIRFGKINSYIYSSDSDGPAETNSDVDETGQTGIISVAAGDSIKNIDAGYVAVGSVSGQVWLDNNRNNTYDSADFGVADVVVVLYDDTNDQEAARTTTVMASDDNKEGEYTFENVVEGDYYVVFLTPEYFNYVDPDVGDDTQDSDVTSFVLSDGKNIGLTETFTVSLGRKITNIDAGVSIPQGGISGLVWEDTNKDGVYDSNEPLIEGVEVVLNRVDGQVLDNTLTDADGRYAFPDLDANTYFITFKPSANYDFTIADATTDDRDSDVTESKAVGSTDNIQLTDGTSINDIYAGLVNTTGSICGSIWIDSNGNGVEDESAPQGDPDCSTISAAVSLYSSDGLLVNTIETNTNNSYCFSNVAAGDYYIIFAPNDSDFVITTPDQDPDDIMDSDVTGENGQLSTATFTVGDQEQVTDVDAGFFKYAAIGDFVWLDSNGDGLQSEGELGVKGVVVRLIDNDNEEVGLTTTDSLGRYVFEELRPGRYFVSFQAEGYSYVDMVEGDELNSDVTFEDSGFGFTGPIVVTSCETNYNIDAGLKQTSGANGSISGSVWVDVNSNGIRDEPGGVADLRVELFDDAGSVVQIFLTNDQGDYEFLFLEEGNYYVKVYAGDTQSSTTANVGEDDSVDSDFTDANGAFTTDIINLATDQVVADVDLGLIEQLSIGDRVWSDINQNGVQDEGEPGFGGVAISIEQTDGDFTGSTTTDIDGSYLFTNLPEGTYVLTFTAPSGTIFTGKDASLEEIDSDVNEAGVTDEIVLTLTNGSNLDVDAGVQATNGISGKVYVDLNANGTIENNESGLGEVIVHLFDTGGTLVTSTQTANVTGDYFFAGINADDYYIQFEIPEGYLLSPANVVGDDSIDSDITNANGEGTTDVINYDGNQLLENIDGAIYQPASIGDKVWNDANQNGIQDADEPGVAGVTVVAYRSFGLAVDTVVTDDNGMYRIDGLKQGLYYIEFKIGEGYVFSPKDAGGDDSKDSDADGTGATSLISISHGANLDVVDCGIYEMESNIRSIVWDDTNGDGMRQTDEPRINKVQIELIDESGQVVGTTTTNALGKYAFERVTAGSYVIRVNLDDTDYKVTQSNVGDDMMDNDIMQDGKSEMFSVDVGSISVPNIDVGLYKTASLNLSVWQDENQNARYEETELPLQNIEVRLYDAEDNMVHSIASSDEVENIVFEDVEPGLYYVKYMVDSTYVPSMSDRNVTLDNNSDLIEEDGEYLSPLILVESSDKIRHIDAGFYKEEAEDVDGIVTKPSVTEVQAMDIQVGPNPSTYYVEVTDKNLAVKGAYTLSLLDRNGKVIRQEKTNTLQHHRVSLVGLQSGIYYLQVQTADDIITRKLLRIEP